MQYIIYLQVPEYTKEYLLHHFSRDGQVVECKKYSPIIGFMQLNLRKRLNFYPEEEMGNLKVAIPNVDENHTKETYNFLSKTNRSKLATIFRNIMISHLWCSYIKEVRLAKADRRKKTNTINDFVIDFCQKNGIRVTSDSLNRFLVEINREKTKLKSEYNIEL